jgi:hypothetical protein
VIEVLGTGGMGRVYLGRSAGGRLVAVKVIRADLSGDPEFRARFRREVEAARKVHGFYTALVVDADADGPVPWLATAYVAAPSLGQAVASGGPLAPDAVQSLAAGLAEGLAAIHRAGVVHRDLKPSNVLLAADGPRVIDFGISRAAEASSLTQTGLIIGSPGYMSPEQAEGRDVGPASDVFSLGAVVCFAATGHGPFGSGSAAALAYRVVHGVPDLGGVPGGLRYLLERCLAKDPGSRPAAAAILAELASMRPAGWTPAPAGAAPEEEQPGTAGSGPVPGAIGETAVTAAPSRSSVPDRGPAPATVSSVPGTVPAAPVMPPVPAVAAAAPVPLAGKQALFPPGRAARRRLTRRRAWLAAVAVGTAAAAAIVVPLVLHGPSPSEPAPALVGVYSGGRYGFTDPFLIAADRAHVWVANYDGEPVTEMDARTGAWVQTISGSRYGFSSGLGGHTGIVDDGRHVWILNGGLTLTPSVTELNASDGSLVRVIRAPANADWYQASMASDGSLLWVASYAENALWEYSVSDGRLLRVVQSAELGGPTAVAIDGQHVWVGGKKSLTEIDAATAKVLLHSVLDQTDVPPAALTRCGAGLCVLEYGKSVIEVSLADGRVIRELRSGQQGVQYPAGIAADGSRIWVANRDGHSVTEYDAGSGAWVREAAGADYGLAGPWGITVAAGRVWVADYERGSVTALTAPQQ